MSNSDEVSKMVERRFFENGFQHVKVEARGYPEETVFIVQVPPPLQTAAEIANALDRELAQQGFRGFVTVREAEQARPHTSRLSEGVKDPRVTNLVGLIATRARTTLVQPSLSYIPDSANAVETAITARHHLIFGRRGAGKTALMVEAKRRATEAGWLSLWINLQTHRYDGVERAFVSTALEICNLVQEFYASKQNTPGVLSSAANLALRLEELAASPPSTRIEISGLVPQLHGVVQRFLRASDKRLYIFIDELHYIPREEQPKLLDMLHGCVRDADAWLKVAGIKHLSRWFQTRPLLGLQLGHDADPIELDLTLERPSSAKGFLERMLGSYAEHVGIPSLTTIFSGTALDRLVLAAGAVPRDYLILSSGALRQARGREGARNVGVQDVNSASGEAANGKIAEA
jgi:hypothetical protein